MAMDVTERFSSRVADYVKWRPGYPEGVVRDLAASARLAKGAVVADVGSGTGLLARDFLKAGFRVVGVEPNDEMRAAGEKLLAGASFLSVAGRAEETGLKDESVDLVVAGQAFHWFDQGKAREEFRRILRGEKRAAMVWNERMLAASAFLRRYEAMMKRWATDYDRVDHRLVTEEVMRGFFAAGTMVVRRYPNEQVFDLEGVKGRVMSSSYAPASGEKHAGMMRELEGIFAEHQEAGRVRFLYETVVYEGRV
jgi:SAM-dependent methyltransferase